MSSEETVDPESGETPPDNTSEPFPNPGETAQDHDARVQDRLIFQYRDDEKMTATISLFAEGAQGIEDCAVTIPALDDPDVVHFPSRDSNLDVTGELIGQKRVLANGTVPDDTLFRIYIAMRKLRNSTIGSTPEYIAALETIFGATPGTFRLVALGGMWVVVEIDGEPTDDQKALMDEFFGPVPRAMAVGVSRVWYDGASYFGFDDDPDALGFGELGDPDPGGRFPELF